jgi:hypothetical protein
MSDLNLSREHRIYTARKQQLGYNLKAIGGGRPYIDLRLHRAPNESDLSWLGFSDLMPGRKRRAYLLNDAGRIAAKINQYLFAKPASREGIDEAFRDDCTTTRLAVHQFWEMVSEWFTAGEWVWLHCDRGAPEMDASTGRPRLKTLAERQAVGDRVYWSAYRSLDVVDWAFDLSGRLLWLLTSESRYENADPFTEPATKDLRVLWRRGQRGTGATWERWISGQKGDATQLAAGTVSTTEIPFVLLGYPTDAAWWFDDVEMIQAELLNKDSQHSENLTRTVYPQLVIPASMAQSLEAKLIERTGMQGGARVTELVREIIRGLDSPFIEDAEHNGLTRFLQPSAADLDAIPQHVQRLRKNLFDMAGLALFNRETRQVQSAEAKQFDHLDTAATLRNRAMLLQEAESKLVEMSVAIDSTFAAYEAVWPQDFDVPNTADDVAALTQVGNFAELTPTMRKQLLRTATRIMDNIERISDEDRAAIMEEIEALVEEADLIRRPFTYDGAAG